MRDLFPESATREERQRLTENREQLFTSDLSVSEFALLYELGYSPLGLVMGTCVYQIGYQGAAWTESVELSGITQAMYTARHLAMSRMVAEASFLGADGIVGMRLELGGKHLGLANNMLEFIAVGTAVRFPAGEQRLGTEPFTSDLNGQDLYKLHRIGFRPVSLVMGNCVYHVATQAVSQYAVSGQNGENKVYTQAIYHARELAMDRMQAEALKGGANGIVGVQVSEHARGWDKQVFEFMAIGTSIRKIDAGVSADPGATRMVLNLND
ncbi:heavy metal-binding domain-containing protein [Deinococcus radiomollis]|uniref:heavy metal-binding domain-containing protein n=1 Tax=Deinococcus radiomollis TaxID=468916 RepID=UPI003891CB57